MIKILKRFALWLGVVDFVPKTDTPVAEQLAYEMGIDLDEIAANVAASNINNAPRPLFTPENFWDLLEEGKLSFINIDSMPD